MRPPRATIHVLFRGGLLTTASASASVLSPERAARAAEPTAATTASDVTVRGTTPALSAGFVSAGSEADATREVTDVAGLIEPLPGVHIRRLGADDTFSTLSVRGSTSSEVATLFAGVPLTGAADPSLDLASLPLWPGARVKVYRSFTPASVGSGSLGGTLVLEPPRTTDAEGTLAWLAVGSFGEERLRLADVRAFDDGRARVVTALSASRATDDFSYYDPTHPSAAAYATRQNAGYAALSGFTAVALRLDLGRGEPGTVTLTALAQSRLQHLPGSIDYPTEFAELSTNRELLSVDVAKPTRSAGSVHLLGWTRRDEITNRDQPGPFGSGALNDKLVATDDVIIGAGGAASWHGPLSKRASLDVRVDGSFERFAPGDDLSAFGTEPGATRTSIGGGGDFAWKPVARWTLDASLRFDTNVDAVDTSPSVPGVPGTPGPARGTDVHPTGHLGSEVLVGPVALAAHAGALARPPSFIERYGGEGVLANPDLVSETALTADVGAVYAPATHGVKARLELDGFATHATDLITLVPDGAFGRLKAENIASARIYGVEASADLRGHGFDLRAAYTGLWTFNDDPTEFPLAAGGGRPPLPGRPARDFVGDLAYAFGPVRVRYGVDDLAGLYLDENGSVRAPARLLQSTGVRVAVPWIRALRLAFDVNNLFDVRTGFTAGYLNGPPVREPIGDQFAYPLPGRSFLLSARWSPADGTEPARSD